MSLFFRIVQFCLISFFLMSCSKPIYHTATLGVSDKRRVTIVGEHARTGAALYFKKKYGGLVWHTPHKSKVTNVLEEAMQSAFGPGPGMKKLMKEFESLSRTMGEWEIIIPERSHRFFLVTLRNMEDNAVYKARGTIYFLDVDEWFDESVVDEIFRVFGPDFDVKFSDEDL